MNNMRREFTWLKISPTQTKGEFLTRRSLKYENAKFAIDSKKVDRLSM